LGNRGVELILKVVIVVTVLLLLLNTFAQAATITVDPATSLQTMKGWEATVGAYGPLFKDNSPTWSPLVAEKLVNELGLNRVRLEIYPSAENTTDYFAQRLAGTISQPTWLGSRGLVVNDNADANVRLDSGFKWTYLDWIIDNFVVDMRDRLIANGETLSVNFHFVADAGQSTFHRDSTSEYAEYVLATYDHMNSTYGWLPDSWTVQLEPNVNSWTATQVGNCLKAAGDRLAAGGYTSNIHFVSPDNDSISSSVTSFDTIWAITGVSSYLKSISYHSYSGSNADRNNIRTRAINNSLFSGMTEHIGADYIELHTDIVEGRVSFWQQYADAHAVPDDGTVYYTLTNHPTVPNPTITSRAKLLRQYFLKVRMGAVRKGATSSDGNLAPLAFQNTNGKYVVVVKAAASSGTFTVGGLPAGTYGIKWSTAASYDQDNANQTISAGQNITTSINAAGALTIFQISSAPTAITLPSFSATGYDTGVFIEWRTGLEVDNLGFNIYREDGGKCELVNRQLIAGSALITGSGVVMQAGQSYAWWDKGIADCASRIADCKSMQYWLEDVDLNGRSTWHGPFFSKFVGGAGPARGNSSMLGRGGDAQAGPTVPVERAALPQSGKPEQIKPQSGLAGQPAVKLWVKREGLYRVTAAELAQAGLDPKADTRFLQLYADGQQIPINVITDKEGLLAAIEFYGRGLDAAYTDARVYWLLSGSQPGLRIEQVKGPGQPTAAQSFLYTVERRDRVIYFSALRNGEKENFFGPVIATSPVDQSLALQHIDRSAAGAATIEVALQGVTTLPHKVWVYLNGVFAGEVSFTGQTEAISRLTVAQSLLTSGENHVRLVAQGGPSDISLVDYVRLSYCTPSRPMTTRCASQRQATRKSR